MTQFIRTSAVKAAISVLIVDDHQMFAEAVASALEAVDDGEFEIQDIAGSVADARAKLDIQQADVVLMDYRLPDGRGTEAARELIDHYPRMRIIMLTATPDDAILTEALRAGCAGYVNKAESIEYLSAAVRAAHSGTTAINPDLLGKLVRGERGVKSSTDLTPREMELMVLMTRGLNNAELVQETGLTINTVRNHVQNILEKLDVHSRLEAVAKALREGMVPSPGD